MPFLFSCWFVTLLAETNRTPFDFAEGESELVSGFNVEYGGGKFAFIFMAEYINILIVRAYSAALFFSAGAGRIIGQIGLLFLSFGLAAWFVVVRATLPRIRYDQLIMLTWKRFLPFSLFLLGMIVVIMPMLPQLGG